MKTLIAAVAAFAVTSLAPAALAAQADESLTPLVGTWKAMAGPNKDVPLILKLSKENKIELVFTTPMGEERAIRGEFVIDSSKTPKQMTWSKLKIEDRDVPDNLAIYELKDDELKIAAGGSGQGRPAEFPKDAEGPPRTLTFTREKAK